MGRGLQGTPLQQRRRVRLVLVGAGASGRHMARRVASAACGFPDAAGRGAGVDADRRGRPKRAGLWDAPGHSEAAAGVQVWQRKHLAMSGSSHITPTARTPAVTPLTRVGCERANALRPHAAIAPLALWHITPLLDYLCMQTGPAMGLTTAEVQPTTTPWI